MANEAISQLPTAPSPLVTDIVPIVSGGTTSKLTLGSLATVTGGLGLSTVRAAGAVGNGTTDDRAAILTAAATASGSLYFAPGTYRISASTTFSIPVWLAPGAILQPDSGAVITFNQRVIAETTQIFSGAGSIVIGSATPIIYAEWWGAKSDGVTDDSGAINAALASMTHGGILQLLARPYKTASTITFANHSTTLQGTTIGPSPYDSGGGLVTGTQIIGTNGVNGISIPGYDYPVVRNLGVSLATGASSACVGLLATTNFNLKILDVRVTNFSTQVRLINNDTDSYLERIYAASVGVTVSPVVGIEIASPSAQNPSTYLSHCISASTSYSGTAYAYWLHGTAINDTLFDNCEGDSCTYCFYVDGTSVGQYSNMDIHLRGCVADSVPVSGYGFYVNNLASAGNGGMLEIVDSWVSGGGTGSIGIYVAGSSARVRVSGNQVNGNTGLPIGIYVQSGSGSIITDNVLLDCSNAGIICDNNVATTIANNQGFSNTAAGMGTFIALLSGSSHVSVMGNCANGSVSGAITNGITAATSCDYCNVIGNCIPSTTVTTPYSLNLGSNTHTVQLGTTA